MSLLTQSQSFSHKRFNRYVNHKKKLSLRHPLPTFGTFSFFQPSLWLGDNEVHTSKSNKILESELTHLFQCCILIPRECPHKTPFQHTVLQHIWTQGCVIRENNITDPIANPVTDTLVPLWTNFNANGSVRWRTSVYLNLFHWPMGKNSGNPNGVCWYLRAMGGEGVQKSPNFCLRNIYEWYLVRKVGSTEGGSRGW